MTSTLDLVLQTLGKSVFYAHSIDAPSSPKPGVTYPVLLDELAHRHFSPVVFKEYVRSFVKLLFGARRPSAISRLVVSVYVYAIKLVRVGGAWAYIIKERLKIVRPPVAYFDASPAVKAVVLVLWVATPLLHVSPAGVLTRAASTMRGEELTTVAAAAFYFPEPELLASGFYLHSALTPTLPHGASDNFLVRRLQHQEPPKLHSPQINPPPSIVHV